MLIRNKLFLLTSTKRSQVQQFSKLTRLKTQLQKGLLIASV